MTTFCPACETTVTPFAESAAGKQLWRCASCGAVLKEEPAGTPAPASTGKADQVLGRIAIAKVTPAEALAARAEAEARAAAQARARAAAAAARKPQTPAEPAGPAGRPDAIELPEYDEEFVLESAGGERKVELERSTEAAPSKQESVAEPLAPGAARAVLFERILLADAGEPLREQLCQALLQSGSGGKVTGCATGVQFLQAATAELSRTGALPLAVLDTDLPVLGGAQLAVALRAVERGLGVPPTPILFFSVRPCDAAMRQLIEHCQPARYLAKGEGSPSQVAARLVQVLASLRG